MAARHLRGNALLIWYNNFLKKPFLGASFVGFYGFQREVLAGKIEPVVTQWVEFAVRLWLY